MFPTHFYELVRLAQIYEQFLLHYFFRFTVINLNIKQGCVEKTNIRLAIFMETVGDLVLFGLSFVMQCNSVLKHRISFQNVIVLSGHNFMFNILTLLQSLIHGMAMKWTFTDFWYLLSCVWLRVECWFFE